MWLGLWSEGELIVMVCDVLKADTQAFSNLCETYLQLSWPAKS